MKFRKCELRSQFVFTAVYCDADKRMMTIVRSVSSTVKYEVHVTGFSQDLLELTTSDN